MLTSSSYSHTGFFKIVDTITLVASKFMMSSKSFEECGCVELFAEEMLKCLLRDSNIHWNPRWGFQVETSYSVDGVSRDLLPDLNVCRGLLSESVSTASRRFRPRVIDEGSYIWDGVTNSTSNKELLLLRSLEMLGCRGLRELNYGFFTFMAIVNDLCVRFHRAGQSYLIAHVLKAVMYVMREMTVHTPELFRRQALGFLEEMAKKNT